MTVSEKTKKKWLGKLNARPCVLTEQDIIYLRSHYRKLEKERDSGAAEFRATFYDTLASTAIKLTKEHSEKGRQYLLDKSLKKNGDRRKNCKLTEKQLNVLRCPDLYHYLVDISDDFSTSGKIPIYRAVAADGSYFDYTGVPYFRLEVLDEFHSITPPKEPKKITHNLKLIHCESEGVRRCRANIKAAKLRDKRQASRRLENNKKII